ncbi:HAD family hydrolase [Branchiibius hedensis]|uniref:HAD family hydrolase n=1 Tax=Branchiibius hedensis TaxID=672460 RepID=UPI001472EAEE|nr:HAD family hydrolase [Branchiibius hedensis]
MTAVDGVLLDVDDTVLDTRSAMITGAEAGVSAVWPALSAAQAHEVAVAFYQDGGRHFPRFTRGEIDFRTMRHSRLQHAATSLGLPAVPPDAPEAFEDTFRPVFHDAQHVFDDVRPFLDFCREAGVPVGALTNSSAAMTADKLAVVGLSFPVVVTRDTLGYGKPAADVFHHACAQLGTAPERTVYVGDEYEVDVVGSAAAGLIAVWLKRGDQPDGWGSGPAVHAGVVRSLEELPRLLLQRNSPFAARHA